MSRHDRDSRLIAAKYNGDKKGAMVVNVGCKNVLIVW
jgi:hypothetical protein